MFEFTLKELVARRRRLFSTVFAVLLGVSLMAGTLVLTDTLIAAGDTVMEEGRAGIDAMARARSDVDVSFGQVGEKIDASTVDVIRSVPGVARAEVLITGYAQIVDDDGKVIGDQGQAPAFGFNWVGDSSIDPFRIVDGHPPEADDEVVIDRGSAEKGHFHVGDRATVLTKQEPTTFTVAGIATFGRHDSPAGATVVLFTSSAAQHYLSAPGQVDSVAIRAEDGLSQTEIAERVSAVVPDLEVVTGDTLVQEDKAAFEENLGPFRIFMLVFAFVAVFVGAFMINNTFSITVAQRTQQLAMVRALGASRRQVLRSVMTEAAAIGVLGAGAGLAAGVGLAAGLRAAFEALGIDLPDGQMVVHPSSLAISAGVGIAITLLSAWAPARRAGRVPRSPRSASWQSIGLPPRSVGRRSAAVSPLPAAPPCSPASVGAASSSSGSAHSWPSAASPCSGPCWHDR